MNEQIKAYLEKYPDAVVDMFTSLRELIYDSVTVMPEETMWAKLPSYCMGERFIRLIPFKDHINIEAAAMLAHKNELNGYKITPKGMLQIFVKQELPSDVLKTIFAETFS